MVASTRQFKNAFILRQKPEIGGLTFDITESETHKSTARVTDHPIEDGATISDHIVTDPDTLELTVRVSNTPIVNENTSIPPYRAEAAYRDLLDLKNSGQLVEVATSVRRYKFMAITSVSVAKNGRTGQALSITVSLREVITVTSETVAAPVTIPRAQKNKNDGKKTTTPAAPAVAESARTKLLEAAKSETAQKLVPELRFFTE